MDFVSSKEDDVMSDRRNSARAASTSGASKSVRKREGDSSLSPGWLHSEAAIRTKQVKSTSIIYAAVWKPLH